MEVGDTRNLQVQPDTERQGFCSPSVSWVVVQEAAEEVRSLVGGIDQAEYTGHDPAARSLGNRLLGSVVVKRGFGKDRPWDCKDHHALTHQ